MAITPYTGPFGRPELQHLLRRTLFGCTPADLAAFDGQSLDQVIDALLDFTNDAPLPVKAYTDANGDPNGIDPAVPFGTTWVNTPREDLDDPEPTQKRIESWASWWASNAPCARSWCSSGTTTCPRMPARCSTRRRAT